MPLFLEFGEVSNSYNFTLFNTVLYLAVIPIYTVLAYDLLVRKLKKKD